MRKILLLIFLATFFFVSCGEKSDEPVDRKFEGGFSPVDAAESEMVEAAIGYAAENGVECKSIKSHKVINLKNGDRFYFVEIINPKSGLNTFAFQFSGVYNSIERSLENVVLYSCENSGACTECALTLLGNCGVMSCGCSQSGAGAFDCQLSFIEINTFSSLYAKMGSKIAEKISIPKLEQLFCDSN
jgi:hypothetical protein